MKHLLPIAAAIASLFITTAHPQIITSTRLDLPPYDMAFDDDGFLTESDHSDDLSRVWDVAVVGNRIYGVGSIGGSVWISARTEDGAADTSFGSLGTGQLDAELDAYRPKIAASQTHGTILVADSGQLDYLHLARYDAATGTRDTSFVCDGARGQECTEGRTRLHLMFGVYDLEDLELTDLALDEARERIYLAVRGNSRSRGRFTCLVRLNWDGSFDTGFSGDGHIYEFSADGDDTYAKVGVRSDGGSYTAGQTVKGGSEMFTVKGFTETGHADTRFGILGLKDITTFGSPTVAALRVDSSNRPVVVGDHDATASRREFYALRLTTAGDRDTTFNGTGYRTGTFVGSTSLRESLEVTDAQLDGSGNLVLVGHRADEERNQYLGVARLTSSGALDTAYSINGSAQFDLHSNCWRIGSTSVAVDDHDRIVVGGWRLDDELAADQGLFLRSGD
jgi:uncharacterized delta-60 repeat protein